MINQHLTRTCILVLIVISLGLTTTVLGAENEYTLTKYHIGIKVNENNSFQITEEITAHFVVPKHGIIRDIPVVNEVVRLDGSRSRTKATIKNLEINEKYSVERDLRQRSIKIGDPNKTLTGEKDYRIEYLYSLGKDNNRNYDEFYFNLIGTDWDTSISNITFTIELPREFDQTKLGFSAGKKGSIASDQINYTVWGTTITGNYQGVLKPGEALTVRLELPNGYFATGFEPKLFGIPLIDLLFYLLPVVFAAIVAWLWYKYGKDEKVVTTVEFYPPAGFNSAEIGLLWKGTASKKDVISLLIYLANAGYIKIEETVEKGFLRKKESFKIIKIKDYDGKKAHEKKFLEGIFAASIQPDQATLDDLKDRFYLTLDDIVKNLNKQKKFQIYEEKTWKTRYVPLLLIFVTYLAITAKVISFFDYWLIVAAVLVLVSLGGFALMFKILFGFAPWKEKFMAVVFGAMLGAFPYLGALSLALEDGLASLILFLWGSFWVGVMAIFVKLMRKRTPFGQEILGKIRGFKNFLNTAEKPRLEALVQENPTYFYDILPFTYVLNVSDKWIKKFETIALKEPEWYSGTEQFNNRRFGRFVTTTMVTAQAAMLSSPSSSGGSSSGGSGGGSAGGGSGGGGGSSW